MLRIGEMKSRAVNMKLCCKILYKYNTYMSQIEADLNIFTKILSLFLSSAWLIAKLYLVLETEPLSVITPCHEKTVHDSIILLQ